MGADLSLLEFTEIVHPPPLSRLFFPRKRNSKRQTVTVKQMPFVSLAQKAFRGKSSHAAPSKVINPFVSFKGSFLYFHCSGDTAGMRLHIYKIIKAAINKTLSAVSLFVPHLFRLIAFASLQINFFNSSSDRNLLTARASNGALSTCSWIPNLSQVSYHHSGSEKVLFSLLFVHLTPLQTG
jgi:hypothetical protein